MNIFQSKLINWRYITVRLAALSALVALACPTMAQRALETDILNVSCDFRSDIHQAVSHSDLQPGCKVEDCMRSIDPAVI